MKKLIALLLILVLLPLVNIPAMAADTEVDLISYYAQNKPFTLYSGATNKWLKYPNTDLGGSHPYVLLNDSIYLMPWTGGNSQTKLIKSDANSFTLNMNGTTVTFYLENRTIVAAYVEGYGMYGDIDTDLLTHFGSGKPFHLEVEGNPDCYLEYPNNDTGWPCLYDRNCEQYLNGFNMARLVSVGRDSFKVKLSGWSYTFYIENGIIIGAESSADGWPTVLFGRLPIVRVTEFKLNKTKATLYQRKDTRNRDTLQLTAKITPAGMANQTVTWKSSMPTVAKVNANGLVTALKAGTAKITATLKDNGKTWTATCTVTVKKNDKKVTRITAKPTALTLRKGQKGSVALTFKPLGVFNNKVTWTTSNKKIATVSTAGVITARGKGKCNITATATDGTGKKVTIKVTVK